MGKTGTAEARRPRGASAPRMQGGPARSGLARLDARLAEDACLLLSLAWAAAAIAAELAGITLMGLDRQSLSAYLGLTAVLGAGAVVLRVRALRSHASIQAGIQLTLCLVLCLSFPPSQETALSLALLFALPAALALPFPRNLAWSLGGSVGAVLLRFVILPPAFLGQAGMGLDALPAFILIPLVTALPAGLALPAWRERDRLRESLIAIMRVNQSYQDYSLALEERSAAAERLRLSRDIHDTVGYALTSAIMSLEAAKIMAAKEPERIPEFIDSARQGAEQALADVRSFLSDLRARDSRAPGGVQALMRTVETFRRAAGMAVEVDFGNYAWDLDDKRAFIVNHFVQEGMLNAYVHGRAGSARVSFYRDRTGLSVNVRDDGRGAREIKEGIGLSGMRERLEAIGGRLEYRNALDGFSLTARLPAAAAPEPER